MNTTIVIILAVVVIGVLFLLNKKVFNSSSTTISVADTTKKPYMATEEAEKIVNQLEALGYYKYANPEDLDTLRSDLVSSLAEYGVLSTIYDDRPCVPLDKRLFFLTAKRFLKRTGLWKRLSVCNHCLIKCLLS